MAIDGTPANGRFRVAVVTHQQPCLAPPSARFAIPPAESSTGKLETTASSGVEQVLVGIYGPHVTQWFSLRKKLPHDLSRA